MCLSTQCGGLGLSLPLPISCTGFLFMMGHSLTTLSDYLDITTVITTEEVPLFKGEYMSRCFIKGHSEAVFLDVAMPCCVVVSVFMWMCAYTCNLKFIQ